jgi:hypothetical protein
MISIKFQESASGEMRMRSHERGVVTMATAGVVVAVLGILAAAIFLVETYKDNSVKFDTAYQAVLLTNGSVYFGKLERYGTSSPVLRDVYYMQSGTSPETKQTTNVLIKRGKELHAPDRMYLNPTQILLVEPVGAESKVAQSIAQEKTKGQ